MNLLQEFIIETGSDEIQSMNELQDSGIISDNCVESADVADADCERAVDFLNTERDEK